MNGQARGRTIGLVWPRVLRERNFFKQLRRHNYKLIKLRSIEEDDRRREFVLAVMLIGLIAVAVAATMITLVNSVMLTDYQGAPPIAVIACLALFSVLYWLRYWHLSIASHVFVILLLSCGLIPMALWGIALPQGLLTCALAITVAGILLSAKWALILTTITTGLMALLASLHANGVIAPRTEWHNINPTVTDAVVFAITFGAIAMVSWLSHRQIMGSLYQAQKSQKELTIERNSLERRIQERTRELEQSQLEQTLQLQRFAEFGRVSSGLVHDIMNPLTAATLNLDQVRSSEEVEQARKSLIHIERYVEAMGKQLRASSNHRRFDVAQEIESVMHILEYRRRNKQVKVDIEVGTGMALDGDPVTFSQVVANLVVNAIDAYDEAAAEVPSRVVLRVIETDDHKKLVMTVQDWGVGIPKSQQGKIFEPFYSTKQAGRGIGIGLAVAKTAIERDFGGSLSVLSSPKLGTRFVVEVPLRLKGDGNGR